MLKDNDFYVVFKLVSGEQVMAVLVQEDDDHVLVEHPMIMRFALDFEAGKERITAAPFCAFTSDSEFVLAKSNIMFMKKLHHVFVPHYQQIVKDHEESTLFVPKNSAEELKWDDEPPTPEQARKAIQQLQSIFNEEEEINWEEKLKNLVQGNDTIN